MSFELFLKRSVSQLIDFIRPDDITGDALTVDAANSLFDHESFSGLLRYREFDESRNLVLVDDTEHPSAMVNLMLSPAVGTGLDMQEQLSGVFSRLPVGSIVHLGVLSSKFVQPRIAAWVASRSSGGHPLLSWLAQQRGAYFSGSADDYSLDGQSRLHVREFVYLLSIKVPFKGDLESDKAVRDWLASIHDLKGGLTGGLTSVGLAAFEMPEMVFKRLMRELLNPHFSVDELVSREEEKVPFEADLMEKETRVRVLKNGHLEFSRDNGEDSRCEVACLTVDAFPDEAYLPETAKLMGDPLRGDSRINLPYYLYINAIIEDEEKTQDRLMTKLGMLNKQNMSESAWFRSMMSHLQHDADEVKYLLDALKAGLRPSRIMMGVNLYGEGDELRVERDYIATMWKGAHFRVSPEPFLSLPIFLSSLPGMYTPALDPPKRGLQRAITGHVGNLAAVAPIQGAWSGSDPSKGGLMLVSRRGQPAVFNLFDSDTSYNFTVTAESGAGKSFFVNDLVADFLSKQGMVRLIDAGGSYQRIAELLGGEVLRFKPDKPRSLNPFWGLRDRMNIFDDDPEELELRSEDESGEFAEMLPILRQVTVEMAFPNGHYGDIEPKMLENAIIESWRRYRDELGLKHIYEYLLEQGDPRMKDLAIQLRPYAVGRLAPWFNGRPQIRLSNPFTILELEELNIDLELRSVVLTLLINLITRDMFQSSRKIPKCLIIDEAWDLLSDSKAGKFIEVSFRRIRKYNGAAGVITQQFQDYHQSEAATAAFNNAPWRFILRQGGQSLEYAREHKMIPNDEYTYEMLKSVHSAPGSYSEVFIMRGASPIGVYRFIVDKHSHYLYTSMASEKTEMDDLIESGLSVRESITELADAAYLKRLEQGGPNNEGIWKLLSERAYERYQQRAN